MQNVQSNGAGVAQPGAPLAPDQALEIFEKALDELRRSGVPIRWAWAPHLDSVVIGLRGVNLDASAKRLTLMNPAPVAQSVANE